MLGLLGLLAVSRRGGAEGVDPTHLKFAMARMAIAAGGFGTMQAQIEREEERERLRDQARQNADQATRDALRVWLDRSAEKLAMVWCTMFGWPIHPEACTMGAVLTDRPKVRRWILPAGPMPWGALAIGGLGCGARSEAPAQAPAAAAEDAAYPMARVPAGRYTVGCTPGQGADCVGGLAEVDLPRDLWVGVFEVSQALVVARMGAHPSGARACGPDCPVEFLNWDAAVAFADAMSVHAGLRPCGQQGAGPAASPCLGYRLPSAAEWEVAARGGADTPFAGGAGAETVAWTAENSGWKSHPVGQLQPNGYGLYDMSGNVYEFTADPIAEGGWVIRGGSWGTPAGESRVTVPSSIADGYADPKIGLRLVRTAP